MSLLEKTVLPSLSGKYEATIKSFKEIENDKGGYVETVIQLADREYKYCIFPSQVDYVASALRNQFGMQEDATALGIMLNLAKTHPFNIWFSYNYDIGRMNVAFHDNTYRTPIEEDEVEL